MNPKRRWMPSLVLVLLGACPAGTAGDELGSSAGEAGGSGGVSAGQVEGGALPPAPPGGSGHGVSARWAYEEAYDNFEGGDWHRDWDNESAALAWGESWVMMSLAAMFRATGDPGYLERLAYHVDGVLAQRDDRRGVADYRGVSGACWRNLHYQDGGEPYCYVVHSGMIAYPMAEFARLVSERGLRDERVPDGRTFGELADAYVAAAEQTVAHHDDQWRDEGMYVFREDASFFDRPGSTVPLNMSAAMGRLLLVLHDVTGKQRYLEQATSIARRFQQQIAVGKDGAYLWNYRGGTYIPFGEDFSHASISADFAAMAARRNVVFDADDLDGLAATFTERVYVDDWNLSGRIGGGPDVRGKERSQCARWLRLTPQRTSIYTAVRDVYQVDYRPAEVRTGGTLISWGYMAEFEPVTCAGVERHEGWSDDDRGAGWATTTGAEATLLLQPREAGQACVWPLQLDTRHRLLVQQWDGTSYREVAVWQPTVGEVVRHLPYEPRWRDDRPDEGVLYRLVIRERGTGRVSVQEGERSGLPIIESQPPSEAKVGQELVYQVTGGGREPRWWSLVRYPTGGRIDRGTGVVTWTPAQPGEHEFTVQLRTDDGVAEQSFVVRVGAT